MIDKELTSRELIRNLRGGAMRKDPTIMPECVLWHTFMELEKRGTPGIDDLFIAALKSLHTRRSLAGSLLSRVDGDTTEHRLTDDQFLAELWKAYKKCITNNRTGPASLLLKDIEERLHSPLRTKMG